MFKKISGIASMLKQAQQMQSKMGELQDSLAHLRVEGQAGGGMVKVEATGQQKVVGIAIEQSLMESGDREMLEDLLVAAINNSLEKAKETAAEEMSKLTGELEIPGLNDALSQMGLDPDAMQPPA